MKLGLSAFAWTANFGLAHLDLFPKVREYGFAGFEIPMFVPGHLPARMIRRASEQNDLECTVCAILPGDINPISPEAAVRARSLSHLSDCIETAAEMGAHLLGGPLYAPIGYLPDHRPTMEEGAWAVEAFQSLANRLDACEVTLAIEPVNRSETFFLRTAAEAKALCDAVAHARVGVTIDTFHANIEEKSIPAAIELLGSHLKHMHISENDRGNIGTGHIDFPGIVKALDQMDYCRYLTIEGFGYSAEDCTSPGHLWAAPDVTPDDIAVKGIRYLKNLLNIGRESRKV